MKGILTLLLVLSFGPVSATDHSYRIDENRLEELFAMAHEEASMQIPIEAVLPWKISMDDEKLNGGQTFWGYMLRAYFCGYVGLHRTYMGTGGKTIWYYYCIPYYNSFLIFGDFWIVLFKDGLWEKYENNGKICVWLEYVRKSRMRSIR